MYSKEFVSPDGTGSVCIHTWKPEVKTWLVMQLCHGMSEYVFRYDAFARKLNEAGVLVLGEDHPGHGESSGTRGFFARRGGADYLVTCNLAVNETGRRLASEAGAPMVLMGHSMGSFIARTMAARKPDCADGFIFMGTTGKNPAVGFGRFLAQICCLLGGAEKPNELINSIAFGGYAGSVAEKRTNFDWISSVDSEVDKYISDPNCGFTFTSAGFRDLFDLISEIQRSEWAEKLSPEKPYLLLSGADDPVGGMGCGVSEVEERMRQAGITRVEKKLYPGARHEILNDIVRDDVCADILDWFSRSFPGKEETRQ